MKRQGQHSNYGLAAGVAMAIMAGLILFASGSAGAQGYPGAQAEAQLDGQSDPYSFPNIGLCCDRRHWKHRRPHKPVPTPPGDPRVVNCGAPTSKASWGTVSEALKHLDGKPGHIAIVPGAVCDISGLVFRTGVSVRTQSNAYAYGARARVAGSGCAQVVAAGPHGPAVFSGLDVEACMNVVSGELQLDEVNIAWRGVGAAVNAAGGGVVMRRSTIRSKDEAFNAVGAGRIWIQDSKLATPPSTRAVLRVGSAAQVNLDDVLIKGAQEGLVIEGVRDSLQLLKVNVLRSEAGDPYPSSENGRVGARLGGGERMNDLPWLSGFEARQIMVSNVSVEGYDVGISLGAGGSFVVEKSVVRGARQGIVATRGAYVNLRDNRINARAVGLSLELGVRGDATDNRITHHDGECVCYGDECTRKSDKSFEKGPFRLRDTECSRRGGGYH
jgi:hypothetical protein